TFCARAAAWHELDRRQAVGATLARRAPRVTEDHFDRRVQATVGATQGLERAPPRVPMAAPEQPAEALAQRVAAERAHVVEQRLRRGPRQRQALAVHDRLGEAGGR